MTIVLALIVCLSLSADLSAQPLPGRPALVVVDDDSDAARPVRTSTAYTYNAAGNVLTILEKWQYMQIPESVQIFATAFTYDAQGRVASKTYDVGDGNVTGYRETTDFAYDSEGRLASEFYAYQERIENGDLPFWFVVSTSYAYDASGYLIQKLEMSDNELDGDVDWIGRTIYTYDSGLLASELKGSYYPPSEPFVVETIVTYDYDDQQRLIRHDTFYTDSDGQPDHALKNEFIYDEEGRQSEQWSLFYEYVGSDPARTSHTTRNYDAKGDLIKEWIVIEHRFGAGTEGVAFWYDSERRLIKKERTACCNGYGHAVTTYFYDPPSQ